MAWFYSTEVVGSFRCSPGCQQSQLSPVSCSPREAEARLWWEAPGSSLPSLKRFWIAWGFKIGIPAPGGKRWPSSNIGIVFPKPVGRAQRIWFGSSSSNALCNMSNWRHCDQLNTYCMKGARTNLEGKVGWATLSWARALKRASLLLIAEKKFSWNSTNIFHFSNQRHWYHGFNHKVSSKLAAD